jgi:RNA polymerase sigma-70 factor, ECF subfamily
VSLIGASSAANDGEVAGLGKDVLQLRLRVLRPDDPHLEFDCAAWSDRQLVFAVPAARQAAFAELFGRHATSVAAVAKMLLGTAHPGCDDVVAEVFATLWRAPERFEPDRGSLLGFLRLQARGRSIDLLRSESSRHRRERRVGSDAEADSSIDAQVIDAETGQTLRGAVAQLPMAERRAIELAYFGGMSYRTVAARLGIPEGTAKSRIRNGLARLRTEISLEDGRDMPE